MEALGPFCPRAKLRTACVAEAVKGHSVFVMKGEPFVGSRLRTEEGLASCIADVLQTSERLR